MYAVFDNARDLRSDRERSVPTRSQSDHSNDVSFALGHISEDNVAADFLHQLIEQAYAAAQASPAAVSRLELQLRKVHGGRRYAGESLPDADSAVPDRHQRVATAPGGGTSTPAS